MSILIVMITVVVPLTVLDERYPGGALSFEFYAPNQTARTDEHLAAVSFMGVEALEPFIEELEGRGLRVTNEDGSFADLAVLDQGCGLNGRCDWLEVVWRPGNPASQAWESAGTDRVQQVPERRLVRQPSPVVHLSGTEPGRMALPEYMEPDRDAIEEQFGLA